MKSSIVRVRILVDLFQARPIPETMVDPSHRQQGRRIVVEIPGREWQHHGSANLDGNADHDKIRVHGKDTFRAIQLGVKEARSNFDHVVILHGNHESENLPVRYKVAAGGQIDRSI